MSDKDVREMINILESLYLDGGYVSRKTICSHALTDGIITQDEYNEVKEFYGSLWSYVGD